MLAIPIVASLTTVAPANAYSPGTAVAHIYYVNNTSTGPQYKYYCTYTGWRTGANVSYSCNLYFREWTLNGDWLEFLDTKHTGSWTPGSTSRTTATWGTPAQIGGPQYCVKAKALSVDGGASDTTCYT